MKTTNLTIQHHDRTIDALLFEPESDHYPLIIMSHGYNGHASDFETSATYFAEHGVAALCYTFCGGSTRDMSGFPSTKMTLFSECEDLNAGLDEALKHHKVDRSNVFLFGGSQGGLVSSMVASKRISDLKALILLYPALCVPENWTSKFPDPNTIPETMDFWDLKLGKDFFVSLRGLDPYHDLHRFNKPVLILQGSEDSIATLQNSQKAAEAYPNATLEVFSGEGHGFTEEGSRRMEAMTLYFVHECMRKSN